MNQAKKRTLAGLLKESAIKEINRDVQTIISGGRGYSFVENPETGESVSFCGQSGACDCDQH